MLQRVSDRPVGGRVGGMADVWQQVRNLGIVVPDRDLVVPRALNPEDLPLTPASGELVRITEVHLEYQGPYHELGLGWGLIPAGAVNFNNGDSLIPGAWTWGWDVPLPIGERATWDSFEWTTAQLGAHFAPILMPYAGEYLDRGGALRTLNVGTADTWIWVFDMTAAMAAGYTRYEGDMALDERFILEMDQDADVVELQAPPLPEADVRALEVRYDWV